MELTTNQLILLADYYRCQPKESEHPGTFWDDVKTLYRLRLIAPVGNSEFRITKKGRDMIDRAKQIC